MTVFESPDSELTLIATAGVDGKKAVVSVTESGEMLWEYPISKTPVAISVGTAGQVYIAQSPTLDEWEAPAPITSLLAVADDAIYVVCDGNLMRLGRR
ncbi:hypothetical protein [Coleofasciculus sp. G2-EDA-02]|uniref:hypothetical protein n=1 Tax=Coleofasciculus sp. G2-EDA-02 TaxID=3069529 RepID=UPI0033014CFF